VSSTSNVTVRFTAPFGVSSVANQRGFSARVSLVPCDPQRRSDSQCSRGGPRTILTENNTIISVGLPNATYFNPASTSCLWLLSSPVAGFCPRLTTLSTWFIGTTSIMFTSGFDVGTGLSDDTVSYVFPPLVYLFTGTQATVQFTASSANAFGSYAAQVDFVPCTPPPPPSPCLPASAAATPISTNGTRISVNVAGTTIPAPGCQWFIRSPDASFCPTLTFTQSTLAFADRITINTAATINAGTSTTSTTLLLWTGSQGSLVAKSITSPVPTMFVQLTDSSVGATNFAANVTFLPCVTPQAAALSGPQCTSTPPAQLATDDTVSPPLSLLVTPVPSRLSTNALGSNYLSNQSCTWSLAEAPVGLCSSIVVTRLASEAYFDYLDFYTANSSAGPWSFWTRLSGAPFLNNPYVTPARNVIVAFRSDSSVAASGVQINTTRGACTSCVPISSVSNPISTNNTVFTSDAPAVSVASRCSWVVRSPEENLCPAVIFTRLQTATSPLQIYAGLTATGAPLFSFVGDGTTTIVNANKMIISPTRDMFIQHTDTSTAAVTGTVIFVPCTVSNTRPPSSTCFATLTPLTPTMANARAGLIYPIQPVRLTIASNFNLSYTNNQQCVFSVPLLQGPRGGGCQTLTFSRFALEPNFDTLDVYTQPVATTTGGTGSDGSVTRGLAAADFLPTNFTARLTAGATYTLATSAVRWVLAFRSDSSVVNAGFQAAVTLQQACAGQCLPLSSPSDPITTNNTVIDTNFNLAVHSNNQVCSWFIASPQPGLCPRVTFLRFQLEVGYDFFDVYSGFSQRGKILFSNRAFLSDSQTPLNRFITSTTPNMSIYFSSDSSVLALWCAGSGDLCSLCDAASVKVLSVHDRNHDPGPVGDQHQLLQRHHYGAL
jgi:hypothetical protein